MALTLVAFGVYLFFYMWLFLCCLGNLKEIRAIKKGLGVIFNQEMRARGATGREFQDRDWFVAVYPCVESEPHLSLEGCGKRRLNIIDSRGKKRKKEKICRIWNYGK